MISAARNVSSHYKLQGRETVRGSLIDNCFENHIKNQHDKLLNGAEIYGVHFQGDYATIKYTPLLNILYGEGCLPVSVQNIVDCTGHTIGGHNKDANFFAEIFFGTMSDLDPEMKLVDIHTFYGASVCRKSKKVEGCISHAVIYCWSRA